MKDECCIIFQHKKNIQHPISRSPLFWGDLASALPTMTAIAKALLHTCTVFCIVTAETFNNRTKLANIMNHPLGWYEYFCQFSWQSGRSFLRYLAQNQSVGQIIGWTDELCDIMILYLGFLDCAHQN